MAFKLDQDVPREIERLAREMVLQGGGDPDMQVQPGEPKVFGTPVGVCYSVVPNVAFPVWRFYIGSAARFLTLARELQLLPAPGPTPAEKAGLVTSLTPAAPQAETAAA